ncbi:NAD(P)H-dependent oxidoreductase [Williamsoniiplasma luminosum]|uniref:NAD(P)H-dependent oxidoreductase n=1 Tax=Williamsoniiplasma luminosum TaxID=214888 RepID=A0A2K8NX24_9MOLU|nr:nitroreductase family protein [Williamsoniiplasma luminosum]ATZ17183.1 NAD(P)H-dependent oxidoreductase [Williamsoniiplasma luminosum]
MKHIEKLMTNRISPRRFDETHEITNTDMESIIEAMRMTPASYGLLNVRLIRLSRGEFKNSLNGLFYHQPNFTQASEYLLFVVDKSEKLINETIVKTADQIFVGEPEKGQKFVTSFQERIPLYYGSETLVNEWSAKQAYITLGVGIVAAADLGIDTVAQEGFDHLKLNQFMVEQNLIEDNEMIVLGLALGKLSNLDFDHTKKAKVRRDKKEFIKTIK